MGGFGVAARDGARDAAREMDGVEEREGNRDAARDIELYFGRSAVGGGTMDHPNSAVRIAVSDGSEGGEGFGSSELMVRSEMLGGSVKDDTVDFSVLSCADVNGCFISTPWRTVSKAKALDFSSCTVVAGGLSWIRYIESSHCLVFHGQPSL